ncbi:hypothetical protein [Pseudonocardia sp. MH-G8]|uniref:hypothetical protein n=1 Tax=Pseudonocardia sp. MH-G8 TaxID=1854588 RepID=UPI000BA1308A|nr:hypothetical protein [Pseudonocardia sp. MH-G8]OZM77211.1 hypothetical protein CFP66_36920 [Pseudonocardia sp. MH-G8]
MIRNVLRRVFGRDRRLPDPAEPRSESDVDRDEGVANSRAHGGRPTRTDGDAPTSTGTGPNELFVGRAAGQDPGHAGRTGAEARAADERDVDRQRRD